MKKMKLYQFSILILLCIALNYYGNVYSVKWQLPMWLDTLGTMLSAYLAGPLVGSMVGITGNLMYTMAYGDYPVYALTSIVLAIILGLSARKKLLETWFGAMTVSVMISLASLAVSFPLNVFFYNGRTGNIWGDGVIDRLSEIGTPTILAEIAGQFYIEFVDKLVTIALLVLIIRLLRFLTKKNENVESAETPDQAEKVITALVLGVLMCHGTLTARAADTQLSHVDYNNYVQTVYSSENGLPCGEANDIVQTNDGILWVGTYAGLYRYNGSEFRWMDQYDSVRNVNCLFVDEEGRLWIGTNDNGLSISINETITNIIDRNTGLPTNSVRSIIQSADGYYYIGTSGSMQILSLNNGFKNVKILSEVNYADDSSADTAGNVAAVTNNGRLFLLNKGNILSSRQLVSEKEIFRSCEFSPTGKLLAGTSQNHIYIFDISEGHFVEQAVLTTGNLNSIKDLRYLDNGDLFVSADNGVGYFDFSGTFRELNTNEFSNSVDNMLVDYQGNLWFSSSRLGLLRLAPSSFLNIYSTIGMEHRVVNTTAFYKDQYYFGTDRGLDIVSADLEHQIHNDLTRRFDKVRIRCIYVDSRGSLWICTYGNGLFEIEADGTEHVYNSRNVIFGNRVRMVKELSDGTILAGSDVGLSFIRDHHIVETLTNTMILTATELPDDRILIGTDGNGLAIIENEKVTRVLTREDGLSSEVILRTVYDEKGKGVFVVTSNGLCYMDKNDNVRILRNFPYYNNYDVIISENGDTLFITSSAGIFVVDREDVIRDQENLQYELLDARTGLDSSLTVNAWSCINDNGDMFFPSDSGVYMLNSYSYKSAAHVYRMSISSVTLDGEKTTIERNKVIFVPRNTNNITITPEIINYSVQIPYVGYYLQGVDAGWRIMPLDQLQTVHYQNLKVGDYQFHIGVFDANKQNVLSQRTYELIKVKEIYDNSWFSIYLVVVPLIAAIWFTGYIVRRRNERVMALQRSQIELSKQQVKMSNDTIFAIAKAVDAKDERTSQHSWRVSEYSVLIAREMGMKEDDIENLRRAALVHDIGKIGIPDAILNKDSRLTDEEYAIMKSHTTRGAEILKGLSFIPHVLDGALYHHERVDGRGYPNGLAKEDIPVFARIIGVADAFDAMTANRVYRKQMDFGYVLNEMKKGRGSQFDPQFTDILLKLIDDGTIDLNKLYSVPKQEEEPHKDEGGAA